MSGKDRRKQEEGVVIGAFKDAKEETVEGVPHLKLL